MKNILRLSALALLTCSLSSCALVGSVLKIPGSILTMTARTVGIAENATPVAPDLEVEGSVMVSHQKAPEMD